MDIPNNIDNIHTFPVPNIEAMRQHVEHLFGGYLDGYHDGLIELAWTTTTPDSDGRYALRYAYQYSTDQIEELCQRAASLNAIPQCNVYIGAALRKPDTFPGARASDDDFFALTCLYVDLDDDGSTTRARDLYGEAKPSKVVVTGRAPYTRAQCWWRLEEPIYDPRLSEAALRGMSRALGGDPNVVNPARVMRLAGSIAWPMKPGRQVEPTYIAALKEPGQAEYDVNHLTRLFQPVVGTTDPQSAVVGINTGVSREITPLGIPGHVNDGRDMYLLRTTEAILIELIGETGQCPTGQQLYDRVWPQYDRHVDPNKPKKREDYVAKKCAYTIRRFQEGKIRGLRDIATALESYSRKQASKPYRAEQTPSDPAKPLILTSKQFADTLKPPAYIVDGIIQRGFLYSLTARTGHGKTAVIMRACAAIVRGENFAGCITKKGSVLFFAGENPQDVRARYVAMCDTLRLDTNTASFYFVDGRIDIEANLTRIRAEAEAIPDLRLIVVDTAAAYFPGDDGNSNAQLARYAGLLRQLTFLPSLPTGIVNCHPVKNAASDNLLPMGGSAFVNEVDGNLTLWADDDRATTLHWQGKFRGPEFNPVSFELKEITSQRVVDEFGNLMPTIMAVHMQDTVADRRQESAEEDQNVVLRLMHAERMASFSTIAKNSGFSKSKVQRIVRRLKEDALVKKYRNSRFSVTKKGCIAAGIPVGDDNE